METATNAPSFCNALLIGLGFVVAVLGTRSKWQYVSQVRDPQIQSAFADLNNPEIAVRVRRLAVLYVICIFGMAFSVAIFIISGSSSFSRFASVAVLVFAVITAIAHFLIDLNTNIK